MGGQPLDAPFVGIAGTEDMDGYWEAAADGGVFAFGSAPFSGSMGGKSLAAPIVGMAGSPVGLWLLGGCGRRWGVRLR